MMAGILLFSEESCANVPEITMMKEKSQLRTQALKNLPNLRSWSGFYSRWLQRPQETPSLMAHFNVLWDDGLGLSDVLREQREDSQVLLPSFSPLRSSTPMPSATSSESQQRQSLNSKNSYRCQKGHLLVRTILPHIARSFFNGFGSNLAKEARKEKLSGPEECRREYDWKDGRHMNWESAMNRKEYKKRKVTSAYKS